MTDLYARRARLIERREAGNRSHRLLAEIQRLTHEILRRGNG